MPTDALGMVNRVLDRGGEQRVSSFTSGQGSSSQAVLDLVNASAREILNSRDWSFLKRWGELVTKPALTGTNATFTNASTAFALPSITDVTDLTGDFVSRVAVTDDATYGDTSFRISTGVVSGTFTGVLATPFPGTTDSGSAAYTAYVNEYLLDATVGGIYQILYEEQPLTLVPIDEISLRSRQANLWDTLDSPEFYALDGAEVGTYDSSGSAPDPKSRLVLYPVPDAAYVLRYQYRLRVAEMTATTDTLSGVPEEVIDKVVDMAYAKASLSNIFNDPEIGAASMNVVNVETGNIHASHKPARGRRFVLRSLDRKREDPTDFGRMPEDEYGSL